MGSLDQKIKDLEEILCDLQRPYSEKVEALVTTWKHYQDKSSETEAIDVFNEIISRIYRNTLQIILDGNWLKQKPVVKRKLTTVLKKCSVVFSRKFSDGAKKCLLVTNLVQNPWNHPTLKKILNNGLATDSEVCEFIEAEGNELLLLRLEALCEAKCEDLAFRLAASYLKHMRSSPTCHQIDISYLKDVVVALLFKFNKLQELTEMLNGLDLSEGLQLVKRYVNRYNTGGRMWKHCGKVTQIAAQTILTSAMSRRVPEKEDQKLLTDLITEWSNIHVSKLCTEDSIQPIFNTVREVVQAASSSIHIYIFAQVLNQQYGPKVKPVCVELYIRALTANMNEIEEQKLESDETKMKLSELLLSEGFLQLGEFFRDNENVLRESILTAFSLHPTQECLERIRNLSNSHNDTKDSDAKDKEGDAINSIEICLDEELLKFAPHLPDDLSTVLSGPRCQTLRWSLGNERLLAECEHYLTEHQNIRPKNKELHFLNIDYSIFEDWPKQESATGIEKGYELDTDQDDDTENDIDDEDDEDYDPKKIKRKKKANAVKGRPRKKKDPIAMMPRKINMVPTTVAGIPLPSVQRAGVTYQDGATQIDTSYFRELGSSNQPLDFSRSTGFNNSFIQTPVPFNCTTPVSSHERNKPPRTYMSNNRRSVLNNCSTYLNSHSPQPAEVPPTSSDYRVQEKLAPVLKSLNINPKILSELLSGKRPFPIENMAVSGKTDFPDYPGKLDVLAQAVVRSDILLAKSVPGMNSVDMIVPSHRDTTVQVVQISNSNPVLTQQLVNSVASSSLQVSSTSNPTSTSNIQINANSLMRMKPIGDGSNQQTDPQSGHRNNAGGPSHTDSCSNHPFPQHQAAHPSSGGSASLGHLTLSQATAQMSSNSGCIPVNRGQPVKAGNSTSNSNENTSDLVAFINSQHEGSRSHISAHIQRVGQPAKPKPTTTEASTSSKTTPVKSNPQTEDAQKNQTSPVYRLVVKDGRVIEQYYPGNQNLEPVLSIPDNEETDNNSSSSSSSVPTVSQSFNHDHFIKLLNKKRSEVKVKQGVNKSLENAQVSSLPKFHQVFGRQIYQSGQINLETGGSMSSHAQFEERAVGGEKEELTRPSAAQSKGVQTVLKDAESQVKPAAESPRSDNQTAATSSVVQSTSSSVSVSTESKDSKHNADVPTSSGVIFACKVPVSLPSSTILQKPVSILKATSSSDTPVVTSKHENDSRKDTTVIRSGNMNALLAAALQSSGSAKHTVINSPASTSSTNAANQIKSQDVKTTPPVNMQKVRMPTPSSAQKIVRRQPILQQGPTRYSRPLLQVTTGNSMTQTGPPVVTIPLQSRTVVLSTNLNQSSLPTLAKVETRRDQINTEQSSVSSTTLEQLREFESVLEQVTNTSQMKERGGVKKVEHQPTQTPSSEFNSSSPSKINSIFQPSLVNMISDLNTSERVSLTFINKTMSTSAATTNTNTVVPASPKITTTTPVVVVQSCSRPLASPALSIASQSSLSPAPQTPPASLQAKIGSKVKPKVKASIGKTTPTTTIKVSALPKPQQKPQEDEQTTQRIYAILDKYAEQLRNSPELKNKPAPRRRSNPPTNPTQSSKRKKSSHSKSKSVSNLPACSGLEMSPGSEDLRTLGSEDSSNGVSQLSQVLNSPQSRTDEHSNPPGDVSSEASESLDSKDQRSQHRLVLSEPSSSSARTVLVQENIQPVINVEGSKVLAGKQLVVGSGATVPLTLSLPGTGNVKQVIFPVPTDGRPFVVAAKVPKMYRVHQVTMNSNSPLLTTASSGAVVLRQMCINKNNTNVKQVKLPVGTQIQTQGLTSVSQPAVVLPSGSQSFTLSTGSNIDGDSVGISLDSTILLNTSTSSSLGFFQRNLTKTTQSSSPTLLVSRSSCSQDSHNVPFSPSSELQSRGLKTDNMLALKLTSAPTTPSPAGDTEFKSEDLAFALSTVSASTEKVVTASSDFAVTGSGVKTWQMSKDVKSKAGEKIDESKVTETKLSVGVGDFQQIAGDLVATQMSADESSSVKGGAQDESVIKIKTEDIISEDKPSFSVVKSCLGVSNHVNEQWQCNRSKITKILKDVKTESLTSGVAKESQTVTLNSIPSNISLKRKLNSENTIFQVALNRADKTKLVKDDFIHQRACSAAALERELRLQKSLSEECEDLGVDKPSTSDLFPEAELLLDSDPLSRDSLQELYSRGMDSSSSSSPNRGSPPVPESSSSRFASGWKKGKKSGDKNPTLDSETGHEKMSLLGKDSPMDQKSESSSGSPLNGGSESHAKSANRMGFKSNHPGKNDNLCSLQSSESRNLEHHDSYNFSEMGENCIDSDLMDSEGDTVSEIHHHACKRKKFDDVDSVQDNESNDKSNCEHASSNQSPCNNCTYQSFKGKLDSSISWFQLGQQNDTDSPSKSSRVYESGSECNTPNGLIDDNTSDTSQRELHKDCDSLNATDLGKCRQSCRNAGSGVKSTARKKRPGTTSFSAGEESSSSADTLLTDSPDDLEMDRLARRSSPRGTVKKGCPCFNGLPEPAKKKRDLTAGTLLKTDKPCTIKATSYSLPSKKPIKPTIKNVNKKR